MIDRPRLAAVRLGVLVVALAMSPAPALAQAAAAAPADATPARPAAERSPVTRTLIFLGGGLAGLGIHESGHVLAGLAFDASPRAERIDYGFIPFVAIAHDPVSRREEFVISSAGFWMQHAASEWILTARPHLRSQQAPFLKGIVAFNLGASAVYSVAAFGKWGPPESDTRGMAISLGADGVPEPVIGALILGPAILDGYRYLHPEKRWPVWASRGAKIAAVLLTFAAGR
ncbi:MAG TPA: hypothetical protein VFO19_15630 [Vicinamibacterales bacterium]|nr:hypothetical protein [Vicinamibacterales bacterium]